MTDQALPMQPRTRRLLLPSVLALGLGTAVTVLVVLPAEFGVDPSGFGALTGLTRISAPREVVVQTRTSAPPEIARAEVAPFRRDVVTIPVSALGSGVGAIEYKVSLQQGQTLLYSWRASRPVMFEFHGHDAPAEADQPIQVMSYMEGQSETANGTLVAPVDGIHGWYFANPGFEPMTIELTLAGYYELAPGIVEIR